MSTPVLGQGIQIGKLGEDSEGLTGDALLLSEIPVVVTATKREARITEVPAAVSIITAEDIKQSGYVDIWDLFRLVPGSDVIYHGASIVGLSRASVSMRGMNEEFARRLQVLVDGQSIYHTGFSGVYWERIPLALEDIERIEVVRGPNAVLYGANAFNGVVNIITKHARTTAGRYQDDMDGLRLGADYKMVFGTHDLVMHYGQVSLANEDSLAGRISVNYRKDNGVGPQDGEESEDDKRFLTGSWRFDWNPDDETHLRFSGGVLGGNTEIPFFSANELGKDAEVLETVQNISFEKDLEDVVDFPVGAMRELTVYFHHRLSSERRRDYDPLVDPKTNQLFENDFNEWLQQFTFGVEQRFEPAENASVLFGASYRHDEFSSLFTGTDDRYSFDLGRVFAYGELELGEYADFLEGVIVSGGTMFEVNSFTGLDVSPRVTLLYKFWDEPEMQHTARVTWSRAFRTPGFLEREAFFVSRSGILPGGAQFRVIGDDGVDSEQIDAFELGYRGRFFEGRLNVNAELFHNTIRDVINFVKAPPEQAPFTLNSRGTNMGGDVVAKGFELAADYTVFDFLAVYANYSYLDISQTYGNIKPLIKLPKDGYNTDTAPEHQFNVGFRVIYDFGDDKRPPHHLQLSFNWHYRDNYQARNLEEAFLQPPFTTTGEPRHISGYHRLDARVGYGYDITEFAGVELYLAGQNLFSGKYNEWKANQLDVRVEESLQIGASFHLEF